MHILWENYLVSFSGYKWYLYDLAIDAEKWLIMFFFTLFYKDLTVIISTWFFFQNLDSYFFHIWLINERIVQYN